MIIDASAGDMQKVPLANKIILRVETDRKIESWEKHFPNESCHSKSDLIFSDPYAIHSTVWNLKSETAYTISED